MTSHRRNGLLTRFPSAVSGPFWAVSAATSKSAIRSASFEHRFKREETNVLNFAYSLVVSYANESLMQDDERLFNGSCMFPAFKTTFIVRTHQGSSLGPFVCFASSSWSVVPSSETSIASGGSMPSFFLRANLIGSRPVASCSGSRWKHSSPRG